MMEVKKNWKENLKNNFVSKQEDQSKKYILDIMTDLWIENSENILSELDRKINVMEKIIKIQEEQLENNRKYLKKLEEYKEEVNQ